MRLQSKPVENGSRTANGQRQERAYEGLLTISNTEWYVPTQCEVMCCSSGGKCGVGEEVVIVGLQSIALSLPKHYIYVHMCVYTV